ncbi:MAG: hypothetical protein K0S53_289 [Bacteroidetes bacterium]|jgi:hypothetical protein|nr:hypothetical protein [Bacteroidota bacterium]MDF2453660.1 hypothetical protein [Bacteroidota bacterium]
MKGVFCIESFWYGDHRDTTTVYPILDLVHRFNKMPFLHHRCGTISEFKFSIQRWKTQSFHKNYPLLYLAVHGEKGVIKIGREVITLSELAELLGTKCQGVVIYFGTCETLDIDQRHLKSFMDKTKILALLGYREEVGWLKSASFDINLLDYLLNKDYPLDSQGIVKIQKRIMTECKSQVKDLKFRMIVNEQTRFPRKRKIKD